MEASGHRTAVVLYGPKAAGKSWVAGVASQRLGVHHVDADRLVLDLLAAGERPDATDGWLAPVLGAVLLALDDHPVVSVEATGAWDSDWLLPEHLAAADVRVLRVLVRTDQPTALRRLASRGSGRAPVSEQEAAWIHDASTARSRDVLWDASIDTSGEQDSDSVAEALAPLLR